jgi:hypothetical protein
MDAEVAPMPHTVSELKSGFEVESEDRFEPTAHIESSRASSARRIVYGYAVIQAVT